MDQAKNTYRFRNLSVSFNTVTWVVFLAAMAVNVAASLGLRGLYSDAGPYLLGLMGKEGFCIVEPSRRTVQFLQQMPVVIGMASGVHDMSTLGVIYSLTMQLLPLVFVYACYLVLPKGRKEWFFFPLLHYLAGSTGAAFPAIVEGPVATAYFWLMLYLILFRTEKRSSLVLAALIALPILYTHEVMIFLAPILAVAAVWRAFKVESRFQRAGLLLLALWFAIVVAVQIGFVVNPRDPSNRGYFIQDFLHLRWLVTADGYINTPIVLGLLSIMAMLLVWLIPRVGREGSWVKGCSVLVITTFALVCLMAVAGTLYFDRLFCPELQFKARNHPAFVSVPLAIVALASLRWSGLQAVWDTVSNRVILLSLAAGTLGWHVVATVYWTDYVKIHRDVMATHQGLIRYEDAVMSLEQDQRVLFGKLTGGWTTPGISIVLSPGGKVSSLIASPATYGGWQPFDPANPDSLPKSDWFDTSQYRRALEKAAKRGE